MQVLKFEVNRQPHVLGGSVLSFNDVYMKLHPFIRQWRAAQATGRRASGDCQQAAAGRNPQGAAVLGLQAAAGGGVQTASGCRSGLATAGLLGPQVAIAAGSEQAGRAAHAAAGDACWRGWTSEKGEARAAPGQAPQAAQARHDVAKGCPQHSAGAGPANCSGPTRGQQSANGQGPPASPHSAQPYIVSVDITRAFDNIDVTKLMQLVEPLFQCERYLLVKYQEVSVHHSMGSCLTDRRCCAAQPASRHWLSRRSIWPAKLGMSRAVRYDVEHGPQKRPFHQPPGRMSGCSVFCTLLHTLMRFTGLLELVGPASFHVLQHVVTRAPSMAVWWIRLGKAH